CKGATFTVELPVADRADDAPTQMGPTFGAGEADLEAVRGVRVLVVDDDRDICDLICAALSHYGARPTAARSCAEARRMLTSSPDAWPRETPPHFCAAHARARPLRSPPPSSRRAAARSPAADSRRRTSRGPVAGDRSPALGRA